jgi:hypothetical protein
MPEPFGARPERITDFEAAVAAGQKVTHLLVRPEFRAATMGENGKINPNVSERRPTGALVQCCFDPLERGENFLEKSEVHHAALAAVTASARTCLKDFGSPLGW